MPNDIRAEIAARLATQRSNGVDRHPIQLVRFRDLTQPNLTSAWLVKNLIVTGSIALVYGPPGCGKSFMAMDLALAVATGREWFGRRTRRGRVVYVAVEAGRTIRNRIAVWTLEKMGDLLQPDEVDLDVVMSPVDLCHPRNWDVETLIALIGSAQVVIIDTVNRAMAGGNENAPDDMGAFITALDKLRDALGCTVIAVHHIGEDESRGSRGHSALTCAADTWIQVEKRDTISVATVIRQRDEVAGAQIAFQLRQVCLGQDEEGDAVTSCVVEPAGFVPPRRLAELKGQSKQALDVLKQAVRERGEAVEGLLGDRGVRLEVWQDYMKRSRLFGEGSTFRGAWKRAQEKLGDLGHVSFLNGYVWPNGNWNPDDF
jgi:RecA-family ATPase